MAALTPGARRAVRKAPPRREKYEQADGLRLLTILAGARGKVYKLGGARRSSDYQGTMQTPGLPDVEAFLERPRHGDGSGPELWFLKWEAKRPAVGKLSPAQSEYRERCRLAGVHHVGGDLTELYGFLVRHRFLRAEDVPHDRLPAPAQQRLED